MRKAPAQPKLQVEPSSSSKPGKASWSCTATNAPWLWVYQTRIGRNRTFSILPCAKTSQTIPATDSRWFPDFVSVTPISRYGAAGPAAVCSTAHPAPAPAPQKPKSSTGPPTQTSSNSPSTPRRRSLQPNLRRAVLVGPHSNRARLRKVARGLFPVDRRLGSRRGSTRSFLVLAGTFQAVGMRAFGGFGLFGSLSSSPFWSTSAHV